jgi:hypothetical protein
MSTKLWSYLQKYSIHSCITHALRDFLPLECASYVEPFAFLIHVEEALQMLHARFGKWGEEFGYRRIPRGPLKRLENPAKRACNLCPAELDARDAVASAAALPARRHGEVARFCSRGADHYCSRRRWSD